ncbi:MAG: hydrogenase maturation nickel metallochaperone HypA [Rhodospirillales bacterium]|nr:hydrogenase maturation nickel metallochaperone HypA [Rhodospirillales bacterium]
MHEMALCESVVRILEEQAGAQGFARVTMVRMVIGRLSQVELESFRFCFGAVSQGTLAEKAVLEIETPDGRAWCLDCRQDVHLPRLGEACPDCGGYALQITAGEEMRIKELEVE